MRLIIFIGLAALCCACNSEQEIPQEMPPVPVLAVQPKVGNVPVYLEALGTLQASIFMEVHPQVKGTLLEVLISEGDLVASGTTLFKIDTQNYAIKVEEAEAQCTMDLVALQATQKKLARFETLARKDLIAQTEWDELETSVLKAQAALDLDTARLETAKLDLERCTVSSPIQGRIGKLDVHPGFLIVQGQSAPLVTISRLDPLTVEFSIAEKEFSQLDFNALEVDVQPLCCDQIQCKAQVTFLDNSFDTKTGLLLLRGKIANPNHMLRPGQNVRIRVPITTLMGVMLIPQKAVRYNQQGPYIYVIEQDQTAGYRQIVIGAEHDDDVIVQNGIDSKELVITDGHLRLFPGIKIQIATTESKP